MSKVKKQHFVPQFYLENFTDSSNSIYAFDIINQESFRTSPSNIAHQKYFYDYEPLDQFLCIDQAIERALARTESEWAIMFRKLVSSLNAKDLSSFTNDNYKQLADYIITQQRRTVENRIIGMQLAIETEKQLRAKGVDDNFIKEAGLEASNYDGQFQQIYSLLNAGVLSEIDDLCNRYWIFWSNITKDNFYTSDHPVAGFLHNEKACEIYFPITPRFSVSILLKDHFPHMVNSHQKINDLDDPENIKFYNVRMLEQCNRQVYNSENDFNLACELIKDYPSLNDPDRPRIS